MKWRGRRRVPETLVLEKVALPLMLSTTMPYVPVVSMVTLPNVVPMMILPQLAARMATAMGRSAPEPNLGRAAGTRELVV